MKSVLVFISVILPSIAFANAKVVGNGGNVIVCKDDRGKTTSVQLLDYFELQQNGGSLQLNPTLGDFSAILKDLFTRWRAVAPKRIELYSKWLDTFLDEAGIYPGIQIPPTEDTGVIGIPKGCAIQPAAFQRPDQEILPGIKRYTISKDLWNEMSEVQRAGLVLHELIYREAIQALNPTSFATRYFNGYLSSATPDADAYAAVVSQMPLQWVEYGSGLVLTIGNIETSDSGESAFYRSGNVTADGYVNGRVTSMFANVSTKHIKIDFINAPNRGALIKYTSDHFRLDYGSPLENLNLKRLFIEQSRYSVDIVSALAASSIRFQEFNDEHSRKYSSISIHIVSKGNQEPAFLKLNPSNSFYVQPDGSIISSIAKLLPGKDDLGFDVLGPKLQTASGETWVHIPGQPGYVKK